MSFFYVFSEIKINKIPLCHVQCECGLKFMCCMSVYLVCQTRICRSIPLYCHLINIHTNKAIDEFSDLPLIFFCVLCFVGLPLLLLLSSTKFKFIHIYLMLLLTNIMNRAHLSTFFSCSSLKSHYTFFFCFVFFPQHSRLSERFFGVFIIFFGVFMLFNVALNAMQFGICNPQLNKLAYQNRFSKSNKSIQ